MLAATRVSQSHLMFGDSPPPPQPTWGAETAPPPQPPSPLEVRRLPPPPPNPPARQSPTTNSGKEKEIPEKRWRARLRPRLQGLICADWTQRSSRSYSPAFVCFFFFFFFSFFLFSFSFSVPFISPPPAPAPPLTPPPPSPHWPPDLYKRRSVTYPIHFLDHHLSLGKQVFLPPFLTLSYNSVVLGFLASCIARLALFHARFNAALADRCYQCDTMSG